MKQDNSVNGRIGIYYLVALFFLGAMGLLFMQAQNASAEDYDLPPRENEGPAEVVEVQTNGQGARVHLQAHFSQDWPWDAMHWQEDLWLKVQWLDQDGVWQDVDGWQGTLDTIQQAEDWMGVKEIWLADVHLGTGPYRWQVYDQHDNHLLTTSEEFYLPGKAGDLMAVEMMLKP
ncbi:MAG: hypothetical protein H6656_12180 [Ardenticatenaceae bacterium]|nr:hypothetical protein [Ardenticatenaceae bacterium]